MRYVSRGDAITSLTISNRLSNCLQRLNIHTIGDLLAFPREEWENQRNVGAKTLDEIYTLCDELQNAVCGEMPAEADVARSVAAAVPFHERSIAKVEMSNRLRNCMNRLNIETIGQLLAFPQEDWADQPYIGAKTLDEITELYASLEAQAQEEAMSQVKAVNEDAYAHLNDRAAIFVDAYGLPLDYVRQVMIDIFANRPMCEGETLTYLIYENAVVRKALKEKIMMLLVERGQGLSLEMLHYKLPNHLSNTTIVEEVLLELDADGEIWCKGDIYTRRYMSVSDFLKTITDERWKEIVEKKLQGQTLEQIGTSLGLTRERVRQLLSKAFLHKPQLEEDKYCEVYQQYDFDEASFCYIFTEPEQTYHYLDTTASARGVQRQPLKDMLSDIALSTNIKKRAEQIVFRDYITADGVRLPKRRSEMFRFVVKKVAQEKISYYDVLDHYMAFLTEHDLQDEERFHADNRSYENKLQKADYVLWNRNHTLRYYNVAERDYRRLISGLNIEQYKDTEISTLKLFRDCPELMGEYDIRDEYELHSLLRKIWEDWGTGRVIFSKMPTIEVGYPERDIQVLDLMIQHAPLTPMELGELYEEMYGVKATTAMGVYFGCINDYLQDGRFVITQESLSSQQMDILRATLTEDFYTFHEIQQLFARELPDVSRDLINAYNLKQLGYRVYTDYVVSNRFASATDYFVHMLTSADVVDTNDFPEAFGRTNQYLSTLSQIRRQRRIIEFEPRKYINLRRLEASGAHLADMDDYCAKVYEFVPRETYFTIESIQQEGFVHELDELYFDDWFYSSLLAEDPQRFRTQRLGSARLIYSGDKDIQMSTFLEWLMERLERIELDDLISLLRSKYGIVTRRDKIMGIVRDTTMYYDAIMDAVYVDYETYYEEV